jgi:hypothetical protein
MLPLGKMAVKLLQPDQPGLPNPQRQLKLRLQRRFPSRQKHRRRLSQRRSLRRRPQLQPGRLQKNRPKEGRENLRKEDGSQKEADTKGGRQKTGKEVQLQRKDKEIQSSALVSPLIMNAFLPHPLRQAVGEEELRFQLFISSEK